jgi:hypothetical protein
MALRVRRAPSARPRPRAHAALGTCTIAAFATAFATAFGFILGAAHAARADQLDVCIAAAEEAQQLRIDGKLASAREKLLECSQEHCGAVVRADCTKWLSEVDGLMPSLVIRAVDSRGADIVDARVFVDGRLIAPRLDGKEIQVDPGEHVFRLVLAGRAPVEQHVLVRQGEQHRVLPVVFPALPPVGPRPGEKSVEKVVAAEPSHFHVPPALPIVTLVAGGVALGVASYFWISGLADHSTLESTCGPGHTCSRSAVDAAHEKLVVGDVVGGVGIGLVALGGGMLVFAAGVSRPAPTAGFRSMPAGAVFGLRGKL